MKIKVLHSETQAEIKELNLDHAIADGEECFVGRSPKSALVLDSGNVSRLHGKFSRRDGHYSFCDLGSSNGSMINGEVAAPNQVYELKSGDIIRLGDFVLLLEDIPQPLDQWAETVVAGLDATVVTGYPNQDEAIVDQVAHAEREPESEPELIQAELVNDESSAIVRVELVETDANLQAQTKALFTAVNRRVLAELRAAGNLTRETYLKAIRRARESVEQNKLIDPDQFEQEAEKYWRSVSRSTTQLGARLGAVAARGAADLGNRLGAAGKAAFRAFLHPSGDTSQQPNQPPSQPQEPTPPEPAIASSDTEVISEDVSNQPVLHDNDIQSKGKDESNSMN